MDKVNRREFVKRLVATGIATAGTVIGGILVHDKRTGKEYFRELAERHAHRIPKFAVELSPSDVQLVIVRGSSPQKMVRAAFDMLGGARKFIQGGDVVLIKPNVAFDRPPSLCATTNPETLKAVIEACYDAGASEVLVADNPINDPEGCFIKTGIKRAALEAGAKLIYPKPEKFEMVEVGGERIKTWIAFYEPLKRATKVIGVAPVKDHNLSSASLCMKNWYGLLGGARNRFHQHIHCVIADLANWITPTLVILDGIRVLMRNGPTGGSISDVAVKNTLIVGVDQVAVDALGYTLLDRDPSELKYLQRAKERGIGNPNWKELNWREVHV
ncbi:MAG: DUF362 domain-containing protein [Armatimonadota bacterium]|nr:DUF362 domain-containing protein [Armatimonadota bacterium]MCX7778119.1 DUF362 domain-containing protein [Armatimonadota bacterium]MDW8026181.1 DUF362 domain-containing protein [Armatimonadota bacterium]